MKMTDTEITRPKEKGSLYLLIFSWSARRDVSQEMIQRLATKARKEKPRFGCTLSLLLPSAVFVWKHGTFQIKYRDFPHLPTALTPPTIWQHFLDNVGMCHANLLTPWFWKTASTTISLAELLTVTAVTEDAGLGSALLISTGKKATCGKVNTSRNALQKLLC